MITALGLVVLGAPAFLLASLGGWSLTGRRLPERATSGAVFGISGIGLVAAISVLALMLACDQRHVVIDLGNWVQVPGFHFVARFVFDRLSVPIVILSFALCGVVGAFAGRYMHREPGFNRFFVLYALFLVGMIVTSLAGTIEVLFAGWEMVGLSSALLVAFFQERRMPVQNGLRVWSVYRISDAGLLLAALMLHRMTGRGDFGELIGGAAWPFGSVQISEREALFVGLLILVAAAGKSALVPFSGWLPRAMEGPTPSSAVFYGALSVHLGAFLLLRVWPIVAISPWLSLAVTTIGLVTAAYAGLVARVQTDIKSALCFSSLTQVGLIVAEIGFLPRLFGPVAAYVPLVHILGHACLRTLQFLRAPTLLQDYRILENAIGERLKTRDDQLDVTTDPSRLWLYRFALERGYLDASLGEFVVEPFLRFFRWCDRLERRGSDLLAGRDSEPNRVSRVPGLIDDLR